jgi:DNA-binding GntR family transcriptional regulator
VDLYMGVVREMYEHGLPRPDGEELPRSAAAHGEIVAALRRGDGPGAAQIMRAHHDLSEHRIGAWAAQHEDDPASAAAMALRSAVQAALLWPGPG